MVNVERCLPKGVEKKTSRSSVDDFSTSTKTFNPSLFAQRPNCTDMLIISILFMIIYQISYWVHILSEVPTVVDRGHYDTSFCRPALSVLYYKIQNILEISQYLLSPASEPGFSLQHTAILRQSCICFIFIYLGDETWAMWLIKGATEAIINSK